MKKYIVVLLILSILTTNMAVAVSDDDDGIPKDDSWATKHSPIITNDKNSRISKAEFVLRDTDIKKEKSGPTQTKPVFGSSGNCWSTFATWDSNTPIKYVINPKNPQGLSQSFITSTISKSVKTWDAGTSRNLFSTYKVDKRAKYGKRDGKNSIVFGSYPYTGVIAVTGIWYYSDSGQILEADMLLNTVYRWGNAVTDPSRMDLQNIVTHELGHVVGMDDITGRACIDATMYAYSWNGDIQKRDLASEDIFGLQTLYGH